MPREAGRLAQDTKTTVDIERLLEWTYRAEGIHRHRDGGHHWPVERLAEGASRLGGVRTAWTRWPGSAKWAARSMGVAATMNRPPMRLQ